MTDVLDQYLPGDIEDEHGNALSDHVAEHRLIAIMLRHPESAPSMRDLVSSTEFFDRALGRVFDGLISKDGFVASNPEIIEWLGGEKVEIAGRPAKQFVGYLYGLGDDLKKDEASEFAQAIFEAAERRFTIEGQTNLVGLDSFHSKMGLVTWSDRNSASVDEYDELVEGVIPEKELVIVIGATQAGKSFLGRHLSYCLARGVDFMGHRILKPVPVVWCAYEGGRGIKARDQAYEKATGFAGDMMLASLAKPIDLWSKDLNVEELIKEIEGIKRAEFNGHDPAAIFIDTHNAATPGASEIDSGDVSKIRDRYHRLRDVFGSAVIVIGHTNALGKMRGNEQLPNNAETVITVAKKTRTENRQLIQVKDNDGREVRTVELWKQREGQTGPLFDFVLPAYETSIKNKFGKFRTSCVVTAPNVDRQPADADGKSKSTRGVRLTDLRLAFFQMFWKALNEHGKVAPLELGLPRSTRAVAHEWVKTGFEETLSTDDVNTTKARWQRLTEFFIARQVIGWHKPSMTFWWTGKAVSGVPATEGRTRFDDMDEREPPRDDFDFPED